MLLVAQKGREREVFQVFEKWGLDAVEDLGSPGTFSIDLAEPGVLIFAAEGSAVQLPTAIITASAPYIRYFIFACLE